MGAVVMSLLERARKWPRPLLMWVCLPLVPAAVLYDGVSLEKLVALLTFAGALYGVRGLEKIKGAA